MSGDHSSEIRRVDIRAPYRHSAGRLGSHFLKSLKEGRLLGWKPGAGGPVLVPPRESGAAGEWVTLGPGGVLESFVPGDWIAPDADGACLAMVRVDGADSSLLTRLKPAPAAGGAKVGSRLVLRFSDVPQGRIDDFWFELEGG